jgi:hypothetical protein
MTTEATERESSSMPDRVLFPDFFGMNCLDCCHTYDRQESGCGADTKATLVWIPTCSDDSSIDTRRRSSCLRGSGATRPSTSFRRRSSSSRRNALSPKTPLPGYFAWCETGPSTPRKPPDDGGGMRPKQPPRRQAGSKPSQRCSDPSRWTPRRLRLSSNRCLLNKTELDPVFGGDFLDVHHE